MRTSPWWMGGVLALSGCVFEDTCVGGAVRDDESGRCVRTGGSDGSVDAGNDGGAHDGGRDGGELADAGTDAFVEMMDAEVDAGPDAEIDAGDLPDAETDDAGTDAGPPDMDGGTDAGRDSGPPDAGTDACVPSTEICGDGIDQDCDGADTPCCVPTTEICGNGIDEDCSGADRPCPLVIRMDGAVPMTTIVIRLVWNEPPPRSRQERGWFFDACAGGIRVVGPDTIECGFDYPDLASGRQLDWFPYDTGTMTSRCTRTTCPGTYTVTYLGSPAAPITTVPDGFDANGDGFINAADRAILHVEGLP